MRGLDPRIDIFRKKTMDCRVSPLCGGPAMMDEAYALQCLSRASISGANSADVAQR
jgi:hypothetical protein